VTAGQATALRRAKNALIRAEAYSRAQAKLLRESYRELGAFENRCYRAQEAVDKCRQRFAALMESTNNSPTGQR
jgi:geranylgeranyl pyrophosphate synthase